MVDHGRSRGFSDTLVTVRLATNYLAKQSWGILLHDPSAFQRYSVIVIVPARRDQSLRGYFLV